LKRRCRICVAVVLLTSSALLQAQPALLPDSGLGTFGDTVLRPIEPLVWGDPWQARERLQAAADALPEGNDADRAAFFLLLAQSLHYLHLGTAFSTAVEQGLAALGTGTPRPIAVALRVLDGVRLGRDGRYRQAIDSLQATADAARRAKLPGIAIMAAAELGYAQTLAGDHERAMATLQEAHGEAVALKDRFLIAVVNEVIGVVYTYLDQLDAAIRHFRMALGEYQELGYRLYEAEAIYGIGIAYRYAGQWEQALAALQRYRELTERQSSEHGRFSLAYGLGTTYAEMGDCAAALPLINEGLSLPGPEDYKAELWRRAAVCLAREGQSQRARESLANARRIIAGIPELRGSRWEIDLGLTEARMLAALGEFEAAYEAMVRFHGDKAALLERNASERRLAQRDALENARQALEIELLKEQSRVRSLEIATQQRDLRLQQVRILVLLVLVTLAAGLIAWRFRETRRLRRLSKQDSLTGIYNRRYIFERLSKQLETLSPTRGQLSVLLFDIDDFKSVNDRHGHPVGDAVLQSLAGAFREGLRPGDAVARVGGEEFLVLLPRTGPEEALAVARRLNGLVRSLPIRAGRETLHVTISIGVASAAQGRSTAEALYAAADEALYRAKAHGKDRSELA
jgi:two-component system cell cycle response regulator